MPKRDDRVVIWPAYIDSEKSRSEGRTISRRDAVSKPTIDEILMAAREMGLDPEAERDKNYPKHWWEKPGRVVVLKREPRTELVREIASRIKKRRGHRS